MPEMLMVGKEMVELVCKLADQFDHVRLIISLISVVLFFFFAEPERELDRNIIIHFWLCTYD